MSHSIDACRRDSEASNAEQARAWAGHLQRDLHRNRLFSKNSAQCEYNEMIVCESFLYQSKDVLQVTCFSSTRLCEILTEASAEAAKYEELNLKYCK